MARTPSTMRPLGTPAPDFSLPDVHGKIVNLGDFSDSPALLVAFICNHCPYVKHIRTAFTQMAKDFQVVGAAVVAISANDAVAYPADGPTGMLQEAQEAGYTFPYLYDESQKVALAYQAACTPDFFLYNRERKLVYRGQMDDSRPSNGLPNDGRDLRAAMSALLAGLPISEIQKASIGCNIKWKPGNEPTY